MRVRWVLAVAGGLGCVRGAADPGDPVPEPVRRACPAIAAESVPAPDPAAPLVVLGGFSDRRLAGDTVALVTAGREQVAWRKRVAAGPGLWARLPGSITLRAGEPAGDSLPLIADPDAITVLRTDLAELLRRCGYRVLDAAEADSVPPGAPEVGGALRRFVAYYHGAPGVSLGEDRLFAEVELDLELWREADRPAWRRRFAALGQVTTRFSDPDLDGMGIVVGTAWRDLVAQVAEAVGEEDFRRAVSGER